MNRPGEEETKLGPGGKLTFRPKVQMHLDANASRGFCKSNFLRRANQKAFK